MSKLEKRLIVLAIVFVTIYVGAIISTIQSRMEEREKATVIETAGLKSEERGFALAELLLPMLVLGTLAVTFIIAKKRRAKKYETLEDSEDPEEGSEPDSS